uniref:protein disulfide-isomerase n=1 Tax=Meloidogyne hapla TaxID=6305 RepID=A0A1I8B216_MELHA
MNFLIFIFFIFIYKSSANYNSADDVVELTAGNFHKLVLDDDARLEPEYKRVAKALKGIVKVGAVDMTQHQSLGAPYNVQGFPTIKIFGENKQRPTDYNGQRTAQAITDSAVAEIKRVLSVRLSGGGSNYNQKSSKSGGASNAVIELTDANFENLEPHWRAAASELKGKMKMGALDATVHTVIANRFDVRGFPTIKFFPAGGKSFSDALDYDGGRTTSDIVQWANDRVAEHLPPPELKQIVNSESFEAACQDMQLCIITFLPHILDCQSECRNGYLSLLRELAEKFKKSHWGWLWTEAGQQPGIEQSFGIGGFGYPAMVALNSRKLKYSTLTGSFGKTGISEFLRDLSYGKGKTSSVPGGKNADVEVVEPWDGKDGELPGADPAEEIDLSDVELEDLDVLAEKEKKEETKKKDDKKKNEL